MHPRSNVEATPVKRLEKKKEKIASFELGIGKYFLDKASKVGMMSFLKK